MNEPIYSSPSVRTSCERLIAYFREAIARDVAARTAGALPAVPWPADEFTRDHPPHPPPTDSIEQSVRPDWPRLQIEPHGNSTRGHRFQVRDARGNFRGAYGSIKTALRAWPKAIVTPAARLRALELENTPK